jgi:hypothetical protein
MVAPPGRTFFHRLKVRFDWVESQGAPWWLQTGVGSWRPPGWEASAEKCAEGDSGVKEQKKEQGLDSGNDSDSDTDTEGLDPVRKTVPIAPEVPQLPTPPDTADRSTASSPLTDPSDDERVDERVQNKPITVPQRRPQTRDSRHTASLRPRPRNRRGSGTSLPTPPHSPPVQTAELMHIRDTQRTAWARNPSFPMAYLDDGEVVFPPESDLAKSDRLQVSKTTDHSHATATLVPTQPEPEEYKM